MYSGGSVNSANLPVTAGVSAVPHRRPDAPGMEHVMGRQRTRRDAIEMTRRSMLGGTAAGVASLLARGLPLGIGTVLLSPRRADAAVVLDPMNPTANFTVETAKSPPDATITPGNPLLVNDPTASDLITLVCLRTRHRGGARGGPGRDV